MLTRHTCHVREALAVCVVKSAAAQQRVCTPHTHMRTYPSVFRVWGEAVSPGKCPSHLRSQGLCANENIDGGRGVGRGTQPEQQCSNDSDHSGQVRSTYLFLKPNVERTKKPRTTLRTGKEPCVSQLVQIYPTLRRPPIAPSVASYFRSLGTHNLGNYTVVGVSRRGARLRSEAKGKR